jgi:hypothetical protein
VILRAADELLSAQLEAIGFTRVERGLYECGSSSPQVHGWLGLNKSLADRVQLFPFVGVRHRTVETALDSLGGSAYAGPLATVQLGYLMPQRGAHSWTFSGELESDKTAARDLAENVERFARPFIEANSELRALAESVQRNADEDSRAYALPVIYRLMGHPDLAEQALDRELQADESESGSLYRAFVARFMST